MAVEITTKPAGNGIGRAIILTCTECGSTYVRIADNIWGCPSCEDLD
jgi:rubrerythrin